MNENNVHDDLTMTPKQLHTIVVPTRNSVLLNTVSTNSYLHEAFDTFGEEHNPGQAIQNARIINDYRRFEETKDSNAGYQEELLNP